MRFWFPKLDRRQTTAEDKISETRGLPGCDKGKEGGVEKDEAKSVPAWWRDR